MSFHEIPITYYHQCIQIFINDSVSVNYTKHGSKKLKKKKKTKKNFKNQLNRTTQLLYDRTLRIKGW